MNGIFITTELEGALAERVHALQMEFDPKMARALPPHITLTGSSGAGPLPPDTPVALMREKLEPVAARTAPITLSFGPPERFIGRNIVSLRLDPHGPLRALHEAIKQCGLPFQPARWPFTPHCTLNLYPELTQEKLRKMMAVRIDEPFTVRTLKVYHTREPQPPTLLFQLLLRG
ncbi:2'-5' RNA ligase family protein [Pseudogemmatithrix spongiicola]|uniref:2'-5' RNA ligase family protein n=1 Tax=Pseudogemmatithrix spongiicola TaxID=3062599 RepID=A0AA49JX35_9BACT|nr:2'-5' RNA ligase family protein [Gemmatimonadaceae bacterium 'strain 138']WKW16487.1 2'-5' RNA ligase family protein [Gemmatimonadaceae bacterium 'strain 318']